MSVSEGKKAPAFTLKGDGECIVDLKDLRGKPVVLYFYPKDSTPGCTKQACDFRDHIQSFSEKNKSSGSITANGFFPTMLSA